MKNKDMSGLRIVTVLDYFSGEVDIFQAFVDTNRDVDEEEQVQGCIEGRGHHLEDCYYMYSAPSKFKLKVDI